MNDRPITVLFLCTGNSARSILAEVLLNALGKGRFKAISAGSHPAGKVSPGALKKLAAQGHATAGLASKSWDNFSGRGAPEIDIVITVCDNAAGESCPVWNGSPVTLHWGIPDPAVETQEHIRQVAFDRTYERLRRRIIAMLALPLEDYDPAIRREALQRVHAVAIREEVGDA